LLEDWIIQEIDVDGASTRELTSDALVLSTMVIASATVSRNASGPRRSTIPAIVNVFRGPGRRCVINSPTPRFYKQNKKDLSEVNTTSLQKRVIYLIVLEKLIEYLGSPMSTYQTIYAE
jgi:hypothetical protein